MKTLRLSLAILCLASAAACTGSGGGPTDSGTDSVVVVASAGTTPMYTWTGPLAVSISVARASAPTVPVWGINSPIYRNIASGTTHGTVPPGATETAAAERTLTPGIHYRATVALVDGTSGSVDFTP